jgi:DNA-binding LacI/PurR family transcriptional regulator
METRIAVASETFGAKYQGLVYAQLRKLVQPGQTLVECAVPHIGDREAARARLLRLLDEAPRPAVLLSLCLWTDPEVVAAYRAARVPIVLVDVEAEGASAVASDNFRGGYLAGQHLVRAGRRSPAIVVGGVRARQDYNAQTRLRGFEKALAEGGLALPEERITDAPGYARKDGLEALVRLLQADRKIDAIFCAAGDACATGLLAGARERQVKVPEQIAIVGYDDSPLASISDPPLSTIRQGIDEIAREAFRLATDERAGLVDQPVRRLIEPKLVVRASG